MQKRGGCDGLWRSVDERTFPIPKVRGGRLRVATPHLRSGGGQDELPHVRGQGQWLRRATPRPRSGGGWEEQPHIQGAAAVRGRAERSFTPLPANQKKVCRQCKIRELWATSQMILPLKISSLRRIFTVGFLAQVYHLPRLLASWIKQILSGVISPLISSSQFPFLPTLLSWILAFK